MPKKLDQTKVVLADWDAELLENADETARDVIRRLLGDNPFWPAVYDPVPDFSEDFAAICLDNVLGRPALGDNAEGS